jgi:uncharacterized protein YjeT (DUF2065 family)
LFLQDDRTPEGRQHASMMMSLVITGVMLILPMIFSRLCAIEQYSNPRNAVFVTLLRTFGLEVAIVGVLLAYWLHKTTSPVSDATLQHSRLILNSDFFSVLGNIPRPGNLPSHFSRLCYCAAWNITGRVFESHNQ